MGRLLDGYDRLQASPLGSTSPLRVNPGIASMNSQRSAMTSALRRGIREAKRKGDFQTVAKGIEMSNAYGVQTTGISNYDERMAGGETFANMAGKKADMNAKLANRAAEGVDKIGNMPQQDTANPNSTAGAGNGTPIKKAGPAVVDNSPGANPNAPASSVDDMPGAKFANLATAEPPPKPTMSMEEQNTAAVRSRTLDGSFGTGARDKMRREEADSLLDSVVDYEIGTDSGTGDTIAKPVVDEKKIQGSLAKVTALGGTEKSFRAAIERRLASTSVVSGRTKRS